MDKGLTHKQVRSQIYRGEAIVSMCNPKGRKIPDTKMTEEEAQALVKCLYSWRRDASQSKKDVSSQG